MWRGNGLGRHSRQCRRPYSRVLGDRDGTIIASGYPHLEEAFSVAELLFPKLGLSGEVAPADRNWHVEFGREERPQVATSAS